MKLLLVTLLFAISYAQTEDYHRTAGFCDSIGCELITTADQCSDAATALGLPEVSGEHTDGRLPGCFIYTPTNSVEFNSNLQDSTDWEDTDSICYCPDGPGVVGYRDTDFGSASCPAGQPVSNAAACQQYAEHNGVTNFRQGDWSADPYGCNRELTSNDVYWNFNSGQASSNYAPVCWVSAVCPYQTLSTVSATCTTNDYYSGWRGSTDCGKLSDGDANWNQNTGVHFTDWLELELDGPTSVNNVIFYQFGSGYENADLSLIVTDITGQTTRVKNGGFGITTDIIVSMDDITMIRIEMMEGGTLAQQWIRAMEIVVNGCTSHCPAQNTGLLTGTCETNDYYNGWRDTVNCGEMVDGDILWGNNQGVHFTEWLEIRLDGPSDITRVDFHQYGSGYNNPDLALVLIDIHGTEYRIKEGGFTAQEQIPVLVDQIEVVRIELIGTLLQAWIRGMEIEVYGCSGAAASTYELIGAGHCNDWTYLPEGGYPEHLAEDHALYSEDKLRECMNRCLDAWESGTPGSRGASSTSISHQAFYVSGESLLCACSSGPCTSQEATSGGYTAYAITMDAGPTIQQCTDSDANIVDSAAIMSSQSHIDGDTVSMIVDYPGYMTLVEASFVDSTSSIAAQDWVVETSDGCREQNSANLDMQWVDLMNHATMTTSGDHMTYQIDFVFDYRSDIESSRSVETIQVHKTITFSVESPHTFVVGVEFEVAAGSNLIFDLQSHSVTQEGENDVVSVTFKTWIENNFEFSGDSSVSSDYFNPASAQLSLISTTDYERDGAAGKVQEWSLQLYQPGDCVEGEHTERVEVDLYTTALITERIELMIHLSDEYREDCAQALGSFDMSAVVRVGDDGETFVDSTTQPFFVGSVMYIQIEFSSTLTPTTSELTGITATYNGNSVCDDCLSQLEFACEACGTVENARVSDGATYTFSLGLSQDVFSSATSEMAPATMDLSFAFTYSRRRLTSQAEILRLPVRINIRDHDCHGPSGLLADVKRSSCLFTPQHMICSRNGIWEELNTCKDTPISIGVGLSALIIFAYAMKKAYRPKQQNYEPIKCVEMVA